MVKSSVDIIAENLMSIYPQLYKTLSKPMRTKTSVTPGGLFVLGALKRNGIMSMTDLGKKLSIPKPHVTVIVDKLIDEGFVIRKSDPDDRRIVNVELTESGLSNFENIKLVISESLKTKLMTLSEEKQQILLVSSKNIMEILISVLSKED